MIETLRLILRPWREADRDPWAAMNADPEVFYWLGGPIDRATSDAAVDRYDSRFRADGYCRWAVERRADGALVGSCGVMPILDGGAPEGFEIGWRLARAAWGQGYAAEAARAALDDAFDRVGLAEVISYTAASNLRSRAVMERIGMARASDRDFEHPALPPDHPLRAHVVHVARRSGAATGSEPSEGW